MIFRKPWDYFQLTLDYGTGKRDVHGGYLAGQVSQELLHRLAFLQTEPTPAPTDGTNPAPLEAQT